MRWMRGSLALLAVVVLALFACKSKHTGTITVDGANFEIAECRSGEANVPKFDGVDFLDESGRRVRFLLQSTGNVQVYYFPPGTTFTDMLGEGCGSLAIQRSNTKINDVTNISGTVTANCSGGGHKVIASVNFKDCH